MELAAVINVPAREDLWAIHELAKHELTKHELAEHEAQSHFPGFSENTRPLCSSRMPILGNDVLRSWVQHIRKLGVKRAWLTSNRSDTSLASSVLAEFARQGVEQLLMIKLKSYAEMDLVDLLRFHHERRNSVTEAQDARGQLGVSLFDRLALRAVVEKHESTCPPAESDRTAYQFGGYAKRILSARERQELVGDALTGACAMRPLGSQIREQVWIGEGVNLADSVRVVGPSYIGARTIVRAGATIGPFASVERDCVVDCGTTVEHSTVLPYSYLAPGLLVQHRQVDGRYLVDLVGGEVGGEVADLQPAGLGSRIRSCASHKPASRRAAIDCVRRAGGEPAWVFAPFSTESQPWLQVQL